MECLRSRLHCVRTPELKWFDGSKCSVTPDFIVAEPLELMCTQQCLLVVCADGVYCTLPASQWYTTSTPVHSHTCSIHYQLVTGTSEHS